MILWLGGCRFQEAVHGVIGNVGGKGRTLGFVDLGLVQQLHGIHSEVSRPTVEDNGSAQGVCNVRLRSKTSIHTTFVQLGGIEHGFVGALGLDGPCEVLMDWSWDQGHCLSQGL